MSLFLVSCTEEEDILLNGQDGWVQKLPDREIDAPLPSLEGWTLVKETRRQGILSFQLEQIYGEETIKLVMTILPTIMSEDELAVEAKSLLEAGLYNIQSMEKLEGKEVSGLRIVLIDAVAGERESVYVRTAGFSTKGRSYFLIALAKEESFPYATSELEKILASPEFE